MVSGFISSARKTGAKKRENQAPTGPPIAFVFVHCLFSIFFFFRLWPLELFCSQHNAACFIHNSQFYLLKIIVLRLFFKTNSILLVVCCLSFDAFFHKDTGRTCLHLLAHTHTKHQLNSLTQTMGQIIVLKSFANG